MRNTNSPAKTLEDYRQLLLSTRSELLAMLRIGLDALAGPGAEAMEDQAPVFHEQYIALQINHQDYLQLKLVEAALEGMDSGEYGVCADCGDVISQGRLNAVPWAARCTVCQERSSSAMDSAQLAELAA